MKREEALWQRAVYLLAKPEFQKDVKAIRKAAGLPTNGFKNEEALEAWRDKHFYNQYNWDTNVEYKVVDKLVYELITKKQYELSGEWHYSLKQYVFLNELDEMRLYTGDVTLGLERDADTGEVTLLLRVSSDVTEKEFKDSWELIKQWRSENGIKTREDRRLAHPKNLSKGLFAFNLKQSGASNKEIATAIEAKFGGICMPDDAKTIINNFKKQLGY